MRPACLRTKTLALFVALGLASPSLARAQEAPPPAPTPPFLPPLQQAPPLAPPPPIICVPAPPGQEAPAILEYEEGLPVPNGYRIVRKGRVIWSRGGWAVFGITYGIAAYVGLLASSSIDSDMRAARSLLVPVAGPFLLMQPANDFGNFWLATWGVLQGAGLGAALYGTFSDELSLRRNDVATERRPFEIGPGVAGASPRTPGLTMSGVF